MSEWGVAEFVSRVAERVTTAGEGFAAQLVERHSGEVDPVGAGPLLAAFPFVEPSPEFVEALRRQIFEAPMVNVQGSPIFASGTERWVVYGVAAVGSLASAAVFVAIYLRNRGTNRAAA
jgi:hypothetical protein